jgi:hypothetical protein
MLTCTKETSMIFKNTLLLIFFRAEGFLFLDKLVEQCVTEVFTQNALTWIRFIIQCLEV